jgi:hypothetical protein
LIKTIKLYDVLFTELITMVRFLQDQIQDFFEEEFKLLHIKVAFSSYHQYTLRRLFVHHLYNYCSENVQKPFKYSTGNKVGLGTGAG